MTRDKPSGDNQRQTQANKTSNQSNSHQHQHQHQNHNNHHQQPKHVNFKPFHLFSDDDASLKEAIEFVENCKLNRHRVCVVSIVSKDAIEESTKQHLAQSILNGGEVNKRNRLRQQRAQFKSTKHGHASTSSNKESSSKDGGDPLEIEFYENQVIGNVDSKSGVIVLSLTSFMESDQLNALITDIEREPLDWDVRFHSIIAKKWPKWNQNLVKSMLMLMILSHVIVFYSPEPAVDMGLLRLLKVLDSLRSRSQPRITELLETIATKQVFSQQWIRQARVACPRALFVCDTSYLDIVICQSDILAIKRDLEDQIYLILKRLNLISRSQTCSANQPALMSLSEREDFVFLITRHDRLSGKSSDKSLASENVESVGMVNLDDLHIKLFESLRIGGETESYMPHPIILEPKQDTPALVSRSSSKSVDSEDSGKPMDSVISSQEPSPISLYSESPTTILPVHQSKFKKFVSRHVTDIQQSALEVHDNNNSKQQHSSAKSQPTVLLPRYDDFFSVLLRIKQLLFPITANDNMTVIKSLSPVSPNLVDDHKQQLLQPLRKQVFKTLSSQWPAIDERRFLDIYDNFDTDNLFSQRLCQNARSAAFKRFVSEFDTGHYIEDCFPNSVPIAVSFYDCLSRGPAKAENRQLLMAQLKDHLDSLYQNPQFKSRNNVKINSKHSKSGDVIAQSSTRDKQANDKSANMTILRRGNGIKLLTTCECGQNSNYMILPSDRKRKLERIDIHKTNN